MKRLAVLLVGSLLAVQTVWATNLPIDPASCQSLNSGSTSCDKELYNHTLTARGQDDVRSCGSTQTEGFVCKFQWPASNPAQVTPRIWWDVGTSGNIGAACWRAAIGCVTAGDEYQTYSYGTATNVSASSGATPTEVSLATLPSTTPLNASADRLCKIKVERAYGVGGCTNTLDDEARVIWMQLNY
jgi:hypothetical protein